MKKILIIGQAPPAVKQDLPYDTTLLYEIFSWVGIDKDASQRIFEFEAMTDSFPGHGKSGHLKPGKSEMERHFNDVLSKKIASADKIIVLGAVAKEALTDFGLFELHKQVLCLVHPSRRNYSRIFKTQEEITSMLKDFLGNIPATA